VTKDPRVYLAHILERANRIEEYLRDGQATFMSDPKTQDAVIRNFEVIGEAAKRVPQEYRAAHPSIPWQLTAGFRYVLIHGYEGVDFGRVWTTATRDRPAGQSRMRDGRLMVIPLGRDSAGGIPLCTHTCAYSARSA